MREPSSVGRPLNLTLPFTAIGLGGSLLAGDFFRIGCFEFDGDLRAQLAVVGAGVAAAIGFVFSSCAPRLSLAARQLMCGVATCASGAVAGGIICGAYWRGGGPEMGLATGLGCGAVFSIAFANVLAAASRTGRARPGSMVDASDRRAVWSVTVAVIAIATLAGGARWSGYAMCRSLAPVATPLVGAFAIAALLALVGWEAASAARAAMDASSARREFDGPLYAGIPCHDYGVGDGLYADSGAPASPYRDRPVPARLFRGSADEARQALMAALGRAVLALAYAAAAVAIALR
jgi:hypothetical protein